MRTDLLIAIALATPSALSAQTLQPRTGDPVQGLTQQENAFFQEGRQRFRQVFSGDPAFGPGFNSTSCSACHNDPVVGGAGVDTVTRIGRLNNDGTYSDLREFGGPVLQAQGIPSELCSDSFPAQANAISSRRTPALFGLGLVEAVDDQTFIDLAKQQAGAVSGRPNMGFAIEDGGNGPVRVGRFGFKAAVPTLTHFTADAALNEMGLTNRFFPMENAPSGDPENLMMCDTAPDPELTADNSGMDYVDFVTLYQRLLAAPPQTPRAGMTGEQIFTQVGCAECHVPELTTADAPHLEDALRNRTFKPYSDFLLHDMGASGEGDLQEGIAAGEEMRTTPLWGVRWRRTLWHDGTVGGSTFEEKILAPGIGAIDRHNIPGSEAAPSAQAFRALPASQQRQVLRFLDSLGRAEFDADGNNFINLDDVQAFTDCFTGPAEASQQFYTADDPCAVHDLDMDGDVDQDDLAGLVLALDVPQPDCDGNGLGDLNEILADGDANADGILDACQGPIGCPGDCNGTGIVDFNDLACMLFTFGETTPGDPADCDGDEDIDFNDLTCALFSFGLCE